MDGTARTNLASNSLRTPKPAPARMPEPSNDARPIRASQAAGSSGLRRSGASSLPRFNELAESVLEHARMPLLKRFVQHGSVSTYAHVVRVANASLRWARRMHLRVSERELVRGALLHDYYLYDWHTTENKAHAVNHPLIAARNAAQDFDLTPKERNIIEAHMWPLPPTRVPRSREAWLVCAADKWCSLGETLFKRR